ncbi:16622_t:CDS:2 [Cetraspora pellucida]|uniref:16622_t:CDS:1 n=1 Tax=Cetraspora pellucida TaxID=1433469 RepID=A0A9N9CVT6_9GLOM|nr:16622_t:CDS:2 [Cetraspora pellucida]
MNKNQLKELLDELIILFIKVSTTITDLKKDPTKKRELTYIKINDLKWPKKERIMDNRDKSGNIFDKFTYKDEELNKIKGYITEEFTLNEMNLYENL